MLFLNGVIELFYLASDGFLISATIFKLSLSVSELFVDSVLQAKDQSESVRKMEEAERRRERRAKWQDRERIVGFRTEQKNLK